MYYVFTRSESYKTYTIGQAIEFLDIYSMAGDLGGLRRDLREDGAWYNDGEGVGVEKQNGRELREVAFAPNVDARPFAQSPR